MNQCKLSESEYRFACLVWENEPLFSGELVELCLRELGWKKSTTYTVLKKLCERGILKNENTRVTSQISREQVQKQESQRFLDRTFNGSLPRFLTAFMGEKGLNKKEAEELKALIDSFREE